MLWFRESKRSFVESVCIQVLKCGSIPRHVAIIMDGNRRYARKLSLETIEGHKRGFERMTQMLEWCLDLGVNEVTVYAFSIDNFERPEAEVNKLMDFAKQMFEKLIEEKENLNKTGKSVRIYGNLSLLPKDIQQLAADIVLSTQDNQQKVLNICFAYTSRHEITNALQELQYCVQNDIITESDITETLVSKCLYTNHSSQPDLLVRTSGEVRLSDFLLWQTSYSVIAFAKVLWPEFTIWDFFSAILYYQRNCSSAKNAKQLYEKRLKLIEDKQMVDEFEASGRTDWEGFRTSKTESFDKCLNYLENKRLNEFKSMANKGIVV